MGSVVVPFSCSVFCFSFVNLNGILDDRNAATMVTIDPLDGLLTALAPILSLVGQQALKGHSRIGTRTEEQVVAFILRDHKLNAA